MSCCGRCGRVFGPGDAIDLAGAKLPPFVLPLVQPYLPRLTLHRCFAPECGGIITGLYLPRTAAPLKKGPKGSPEVPFSS